MQHYASITFARTIVQFRSIATSRVLLSGHNKWSKIKDKKGASDAVKGALYGKVNRDILIAIRNGTSADPELNQTLASVIKKAKEQGIPKDTIENALKKATGGRDGKTSKLVTYEVIVPAAESSSLGSVGVIIECFTDNNTRTVKMVQDTLNTVKGRLSPTNFLFTRHGLVKVTIDQEADFDERLERLCEAALEAEAEDFKVDDSEDPAEVEFVCPVTSLAKLTSAVTMPGLSKELLSSELVYSPQEAIEDPDESTQTIIGNLIDRLEANDDVMRVWTTIDS